MAKGGRYLRKQNKKPLPLAAKIGIGLLVLVLLIAGVVVWAFSYLNTVKPEDDWTYTISSEELSKLTGIEETTVPTTAVTETTAAPTEATTISTAPLEPDMLNVLLIGQSYRTGEESRLADTLMLVTINKNTAEVTLTSFTRDAYVDLPDYIDSRGLNHPCGWNKINTAYALGYSFDGTAGAMKMTDMTIQHNFGVEIDFNVEIDFEAFPKIIDILGGVRVPLTDAEIKYLAEEGFETLSPGEQEGEYRLFGYEALAYARMRKADGDGDSDIIRTGRQRTLVEAIVKKLMGKGLLVVPQLVTQILPMVTTDVTTAQIWDCVTELLPLLPKITISKGTAPVSNDVLTGSQWGAQKETPDGYLWVTEFDHNKNKDYFRKLTEGLTE